jgi:methanogenic corrinoid protein MtbC1
MGLMMAGDVLFGAGFRTVVLGADVPDDALRAALLRHRPAVVGLTATMPFSLPLSKTARVVVETAPDTALILGGGAARALHKALNATHVPNLGELVGVVESLTA